ncbi:hypothetical protein [Nonomuraea sp. JJY05]|uniref:hypothetical protein n=1 Tax=Nonomuraea sp. JJY05 TaxID=3350255 RepID=UPI00373ED271
MLTPEQTALISVFALFVGVWGASVETVGLFQGNATDGLSMNALESAMADRSQAVRVVAWKSSNRLSVGEDGDLVWPFDDLPVLYDDATEVSLGEGEHVTVNLIGRDVRIENHGGTVSVSDIHST